MQPTPLSKLLREAGLPPLPADSPDPVINGVTDNSQRCEAGTLFVATVGTRVDSHLFISDAVARGVGAVVVERTTPPYPGVVIVQVQDSRDALGRLSHAWYGHPTAGMAVVGITGTNGKTTSTFMVESILRADGRQPGVIGTIQHRCGKWFVDAANTTPTATQLAELLHTMRTQHGANALAMEVSSHALDQRRVSGIQFDVAILTNITHDHLDYHGTMDAYSAAKRRLFDDHVLRPSTGKSSPGVSVINVDDAYGARFAEELPGKVVTFSPTGTRKAEYAAADIAARGMRIEFTVIRSSTGQSEFVRLPIPGRYNVENALGAIAACVELGVDFHTACQALTNMPPVPGRLEPVDAGQMFRVVVDYAHTPDALVNSLENCRGMIPQDGRIILVFGCGGDRDAGKRPEMAGIASRLADYVIVTNDNPRTEDPNAIASGILEGVPSTFHRLQVILDRRDAIRSAISMARPHDIVLIAGKGHETYQEVNGVRTHFDDREEARVALLALNQAS